MKTAMRSAAARIGACLLVAIATTPGYAQTGKAVAGIPVAGTPVAAVWKQRHVDFVYQGRTARYSCEGLRDRIRAMLLDLGARRDLKVTPTGCVEGNRPAGGSASPSLSIVFSAPALPETAARALRAGDLAATDARFEGFTISNNAFRNMGMNDCELVEEFVRQILPKLTTQDLKQDIMCLAAPGGSRFLVHGEILKTLQRAELPASTVR